MSTLPIDPTLGDIPRGSQATMARHLKVSRQWVSKVLMGRAKDARVVDMAKFIQQEAARELVLVQAMLAEKDFDARHCACNDDEDPVLASELVFTLRDGQLQVDVFGKGLWPNVSADTFVLTAEVTQKLLTYLGVPG